MEFYPPATKEKPKEKDPVFIDRHPDRNRSGNRLAIGQSGADVRAAIEVRGQGAIVLRASTGHPDGKIRFEGMSIYTESEILFDKE